MDFIKRTIIFLIFFIIGYVLLSAYSSDYIIRHDYINQSTNNIEMGKDFVYLGSLTLKQKIAQMIFVRGDGEDLRFTYLNVGGVFLDNQRHLDDYERLIRLYQDNSKIKLFVATDFEGVWNPFPKDNEKYDFPPFSEIETGEQAYNIGRRQGKLLKELGFNFNFAPVSEYDDKVYGGRAFHGTKEEIQKKLSLYIIGLQKSVFGTCKHYPGKGMQKNLHLFSDEEEISQHDLDLFTTCYENNISAVMTGHQIVNGVLDSGGVPSSVSRNVVPTIPDDVLRISDEVNMYALSSLYDDKVSMYIDLINAGNDVILDLDVNSLGLYEIILGIEKAVEDGKISEERIDKSVEKILKMKGYIVK